MASSTHRTNLVHLACPSGKLTREQETLLGKVAWSLQQQQQDNLDAFLAKHRNHVILWQFSSDCTPRKVRVTRKRRHGSSGPVSRRTGVQDHEFLLQRAYAKWLSPSGVVELVPRVWHPINMKYGKKSWHCYSAAISCGPLLVADHGNIVVSFYVFDRGLSSLGTKLLQRHCHYHFSQADQDLASGVLRESRDWALQGSCVCHDLHNAFKWGVCTVFPDQDWSKELFAITSSLRQYLEPLLCSLPRWLKGHLAFKPQESGEEVVAYWSAVGVEASYLQFFEDLQPEFDGKNLLVSDSYQHRQDEAMATLELMFLHCCQFRVHTDSRRATHGSTCRVLIACLSLGLSSIIIFMEDHDLVSEYYSGGLKYLTPELCWYCVCTSFIAYPTDAVLLSVMADDRIVLQQAELREAFVSEQSWLGSLSMQLWQRLVVVVGSTLEGHDLRQVVLHAVHVSWAYLCARVFEVLDELPWSLARGDMADNLKLLLAGPSIQEPISRKIRCLHELGPLLLSYLPLWGSVPLFKPSSP